MQEYIECPEFAAKAWGLKPYIEKKGLGQRIASKIAYYPTNLSFVLSSFEINEHYFNHILATPGK